MCLGPRLCFADRRPDARFYRCCNSEAMPLGEGCHPHRRFRDLEELVRKLWDRRTPGMRDRAVRRSGQNSVRVLLIHDAGLNSIYMFRAESCDHMGPVAEGLRCNVFGPFHDYLQETFALVYVFLPVVCLITGTTQQWPTWSRNPSISRTWAFVDSSQILSGAT